MNERCNNCGSELFAGQQFCRQCGAPTRQFSTGEIPTQILPGNQPAPAQQQPTAAQPYTGTTPLSSLDTDAVYHSRIAQQYQSPAALPSSTAQLPRKRSHRGWIVALLCILVFLCGAAFLGARYAAQQFRRKIIVRNMESAHGVPSLPSLPPMPGVPPATGADAANLSPLDETGAQVSGDKTVINKTFPLGADATFSLTQVSGDITIEGWDANQAQVTITKRGGDAEDRAGVQIMQAATDKGLTLRTPEESDELKEVRYEIKLPRALRQVQINSRDSDVTLSNLAGSIAVNLMHGNVVITSLPGAVAARTLNGNISVDLKDGSPAQSQSLNTVSGNITLKVGGANAVVKAETVSGEVSADDALNVNVDKQFAGERAAGTLGNGGQAIVLKTVSGNIKIKK